MPTYQEIKDAISFFDKHGLSAEQLIEEAIMEACVHDECIMEIKE